MLQKNSMRNSYNCKKKKSQDATTTGAPPQLQPQTIVPEKWLVSQGRLQAGNLDNTPPVERAALGQEIQEPRSAVKKINRYRSPMQLTCTETLQKSELTKQQHPTV